MEVEEHSIALGTDLFISALLNEPVAPHPRPGFVERVGVFYSEDHLHSLSAVHNLPALGDAQLLAVRRPVDVEHRSGVEPDGVDHERVTFVMADGVPVP